MSLTAYFVLLDRTRLETEVTPMIGDVLNGRTDEVIRVLKSQLPIVASNLDTVPETFFQHRVQLAIETLERRLTEAFVNELTPVITEPAEAWRHNVETHVRGALALSLCAERPAPDLPPALGFWRQFSWIVRQSSPTADEVADHDDPALIELTHTGIFQEPEMFLRKSCLKLIADEIEPLIERLSTLPESKDTIRSIQHFYALMSAPLHDPGTVILKGYV